LESGFKLEAGEKTPQAEKKSGQTCYGGVGLSGRLLITSFYQFSIVLLFK